MNLHLIAVAAATAEVDYSRQPDDDRLPLEYPSLCEQTKPEASDGCKSIIWNTLTSATS